MHINSNFSLINLIAETHNPVLEKYASLPNCKSEKVEESED